MVLLENAEIRVEIDTDDRVTIANKRSERKVIAMVGGDDLLVSVSGDLLITSNGVFVAVKKGAA